MRRWTFAVLALLLAAPAFATSVQINGTDGSGTTSGMIVTQSGQAMVDPTVATSGYFSTLTPILTATLAANGGVDSALVAFPVTGYKRLALIIDPDGGGNTVRYAVSLRYHVAGATDSTGYAAVPGFCFAENDTTPTNKLIGVAATATTPGQNEALVVVTRDAVQGSANRYFSLETSGGPLFWDYISIKIRCIGISAAGALSVTTKLYLVGSKS